MVVVGGGFGGIAAAQQLKSSGVRFTLIDLKDAFHHNVGALRASVQDGSSSCHSDVLLRCYALFICVSAACLQNLFRMFSVMKYVGVNMWLNGIWDDDRMLLML